VGDQRPVLNLSTDGPEAEGGHTGPPLQDPRRPISSVRCRMMESQAPATLVSSSLQCSSSNAAAVVAANQISFRTPRIYTADALHVPLTFLAHLLFSPITSATNMPPWRSRMLAAIFRNFQLFKASCCLISETAPRGPSHLALHYGIWWFRA